MDFDAAARSVAATQRLRNPTPARRDEARIRGGLGSELWLTK
jgi:hypothetical protein